jgi:lysyl-tRNA synthetase, class II
MNIAEFNEIIEPNDQTEARREHLDKLRELIGNVYPNKYDRSNITGKEDTISNVLAFEPIAEIVRELKDSTPSGEKPNPELKESLNAKLKAFGNVRISGRLAVPPRVMGKAAFVHLSDGVCRLQIYVRRDDAKAMVNGELLMVNEEKSGDASAAHDSENSPFTINNSPLVSGWEVFKLLDHGDFIGAEGFLFLTNTGELSVHVETLQFLSKSLMPMPDKMHDIGDAEISRRYRYVDLIASSLRNKTDDELEEERRTGVKKLTTREVFERRAKLISGMRRFLDDHDYIEVETPMLTPKATGAAATPFETHHNALDIPLYARIAPELYLKRLTVGGFEKVYELNRNFRNEGLSHKHNPEFTMLEFYCAYMDVNGMMDFSEAMIKESVQKATGGSLQVKYDGREINFLNFERWTMKKAIAENWKPEWKKLGDEQFEESWLDDITRLSTLRNFVSGVLEIPMNTTEIISVTTPLGEVITPEKIERNDNINFITTVEMAWDFAQKYEKQNPTSVDLIRNKAAQSLIYLFENVAEENLIQPTFIIDYPKSISPLSKASPENPNIAERFELFINGMECANGFSELNDPQEQYERFADQMKERETGDHEAMVLDEDYIRALAYGMPPAAGIGIGIDRLVMLLTNKHSIRDVILFPHMRPERRDEEK